MIKDKKNRELLDKLLELSDMNSVFRLMSRWEYIFLGKLINMSEEKAETLNNDADSEKDSFFDIKIYLEDVKKLLNVPMSKVSEIVQTMSEEGYVLWNLDLENKKTYIQVTPNGREKWELQREGMKKIRQRLEKELSDEEKAYLESALDKFAEILNEEKQKTEAYFNFIVGKTTDKMNIIGLLRPKNTTDYLYDTYSFREAVKVLKNSGYTTLPVIDSEGIYLGTVSEGDIFWYLYENTITSDLDKVYIGTIINKKRNPAVSNVSDSKTIIDSIMKQNFLCMTDSRKCFIGIITRKDVIKYLRKKSSEN